MQCFYNSMRNCKDHCSQRNFDFGKKQNERFHICADAAGTNLFFKKSKDEKMTYFCKGTKKVNLQRVILKRKRTEVVTASSTTPAKQVKHDSSEMGGGSSGPANGLQQEDLTAIDPAHSEQGVCEAVGCEGEPVHSQNVPGEDDCNTELTGPHYAPNVTESNSE